MTAGTAATDLDRPLTRSAAGTGPAAPVRIVHLGLGNFFRAHQAWYTARAEDGDGWGIAAFTGRSVDLARALTAQDGLYTLLTRSRDGDLATVVGAVSAAHPGPDTVALLGYLADPAVAVVTLTVTEAGYRRDRTGHLDGTDPAVADDLDRIRGWQRRAGGAIADAPPLRTVPGRLVAGLAARRSAGAGPIAVVPCDNLPNNGAVTATVVGDGAAAVDPALAAWIRDQVGFVTTVVDRITPAGDTATTSATAAALTGLTDTVPVVTEPFTEWVLAGAFPAGRPAWETSGARFVDDVTPYEQRKLWLLNGAHSGLAYLGAARGHRTIAQAVADPVCRTWLTAWWELTAAYVPLPAADTADYVAALLERFSSPRIRHLLAQIGADGSQKLPVRVLPVLRRERAAGRLPAAAVQVLAAWVDHLRGTGGGVTDTAHERLAELATGPLDAVVPRVLAFLDPVLADDAALVDAVLTASTSPFSPPPVS